MDNDVAMDIHYDVIIINNFANCTYHAITMYNEIAMNLFLLCITTPNCDITVSAVNSLKLFIERLNSTSSQ